jgi:choice-of-anchor C domain-containing protein
MTTARPLCLALLLLPGTLAGLSPRAEANLLVNGSFEDYARPPASWDVPNVVDLALAPGNTDIAGWTVINGNIDYVGSGGWMAADGTRSIDLAGNPGSGGVRQTFATTAGVAYVVRFDLSGNPDDFGEPSLKSLRVTAAGQSADFSYDTAVEGNTAADMRWKSFEFVFTATGATTTLEFVSTLPVQFTGPALDNVSVELAPAAVPEPASLALLAAGGLVLVGRRRFARS